jgi:hypothetical protein
MGEQEMKGVSWQLVDQADDCIQVLHAMGWVKGLFQAKHTMLCTATAVSCHPELDCKAGPSWDWEVSSCSVQSSVPLTCTTRKMIRGDLDTMVPDDQRFRSTGVLRV